MVPAMFSTSVLERRKSLDPEMVRQLDSEAIFVDKENRPPAGNGAIKEAVKVKVGAVDDWVGGSSSFSFCKFGYSHGELLRVLP